VEEANMRSLLLATALIAASSAHAQDVVAGQKVFGVCRPCHQVGESAKNGVGPVLNALFGRKSGSVDGYNYSQANRDSGIIWNEAAFVEFIQNPRAKVPGTKMVYAGLKNEQKVKDLIAYLHTFDSAPVRLTQ
jgi:cytochrome c